MIYLSFLLLILIICLMIYTWLGCRKLARQYPPSGQFVEVKGEQIHYRVTGHGQPIVMLHGASSCLLEFSSSIEPILAERYQVICIDRPGLGYSSRRTKQWLSPMGQAEVMHAVIAHLELEKPVLIGHSWSGAVVLNYLL